MAKKQTHTAATKTRKTSPKANSKSGSPSKRRANSDVREQHVISPPRPRGPLRRDELLPLFRDSVLAVEIESLDPDMRRREALMRQPIDAWMGNDGTHLRRDMQRLPEMIKDVIVGQDDRLRIPNSSEYPFSCICSLEITAANNREFVGTGWLIKDNLVVTAGHCVFMHRQGGWAKQVRVFPGRNGQRITKQHMASQLHTVVGWKDEMDTRYDYGCIRLTDPVVDGGEMGFRVLGTTELERKPLHVIGYPIDRSFTMCGQVRCLATAYERILVYDLDIYGGYSGAPTFIVEDNKIYAVGIHTSGDLSGNLATRIEAAVFDNLVAWKKETGS